MDDAKTRLVEQTDGWELASRAIMTTDTVNKLTITSHTLPSSGKTFSLAGIAKGAGMIHPNMATMLCILATDAAVTPRALEAALRYAADRSFNAISVDGDSSTNDSVYVLANGQAGAGPRSCGTTVTDPFLFESPLTLGARLCERGWLCMGSSIFPGNAPITEASPDFPAFRDALCSTAGALAKWLVRDGEGATKFVTVRVQVYARAASLAHKRRRLTV